MSDAVLAKASNELTDHAESESGTYKPTEHDGKKKDGSPDKRVSSEHGFGGDKERASEAGSKGGKADAEYIAHNHEAVPAEE